MNPPTPSEPIPKTPNPGRALAATTFAVVAYDFLLWSPAQAGGLFPGVGFGLFFAVVAGLILWVRPRRDRGSVPGWFAPLFAGAVGASAIDVCFTNGCLLVVLLLALAGKTFFAGPGRFWQQVLAQAAAYVGIVVRPVIVLNDFLHGLLVPASDPAAPARPSLRRRLCRIASVFLPAAAFVVLFSLLLGLGNAVLGWWFEHFLGSLWGWLTGFDLSFTRVLLWVLVGLVALPLFAPARRRGSCYFGWAWTTRLHRFPEPDSPAEARTGDLRVVAILGALNALFLAANGIDASYLWLRRAVPDGVGATTFVHEGTATLIATTLLTGIVLALLFNRAPARTASRAQRLLAYAWIAQNLFLLSSVVLRLKLYTDAYSLTATRLSLLAFLLLDAVGFVLLAVKIAREKSAAWLLGACATAVLVLFYGLQFVDFGGIAARYNVARWEQNPPDAAPLDIAYLAQVGPGGWGPLRRVAENTAHPVDADAARRKLAELRAEAALPVHADWRTWQARAAWNRSFLLDLPPVSAPETLSSRP